jgi:hypothetical protein
MSTSLCEDLEYGIESNFAEPHDRNVPDLCELHIVAVRAASGATGRQPDRNVIFVRSSTFRIRHHVPHISALSETQKLRVDTKSSSRSQTVHRREIRATGNVTCFSTNGTFLYDNTR